MGFCKETPLLYRKGIFEMKKFIASILCVLMVLTSMNFVVSAEIITDDCAINLYVDSQSAFTQVEDELYAKEYLLVNVMLEIGNNATAELASATCDITFDTTKFKFESIDRSGVDTAIETGYNDKDIANGVIKHYSWRMDGLTFDKGSHLLATYKFSAIPQTQEVTGKFDITNSYATEYEEGSEDENAEIDNNEDEATILMVEYDVTKLFDNEEVDEDTKKVVINYDNKPHSFKVEIESVQDSVYDPEGKAEVQYKVNGEIVDIDSYEFKAEKEYVIEYEVINLPEGYTPVKDTFTLVIDKPKYYVEIGAKEYVDNKVLVLVYTDTDGAFFSYGNKDWEMVDVSGNEYKYDDPRTTEVEAKEFKRVFAYVADPVASDDNVVRTEETIKDYEAMIINWYEGDKDTAGTTALKNESVGAYTADITDNGLLEIYDIVTAYGIANARNEYYKDAKNYQYRILRLDHNNNKYVDGDDTGFVSDEVKTELGIK